MSGNDTHDLTYLHKFVFERFGSAAETKGNILNGAFQKSSYAIKQRNAWQPGLRGRSSGAVPTPTPIPTPGLMALDPRPTKGSRDIIERNS